MGEEGKQTTHKRKNCEISQQIQTTLDLTNKQENALYALKQ